MPHNIEQLMADIDAITVSFFGTCPASAETTLVSKQISTPYIVREISASFALNTNRLLQLEFFVSQDKDAPTSGKPNGMNILQEYGQVSYLTGDDEQKTIRCAAITAEAPSWLKVYANNTDTFDHTVDSQITIEPMRRA